MLRRAWRFPSSLRALWGRARGSSDGAVLTRPRVETLKRGAWTAAALCSGRSFRRCHASAAARGGSCNHSHNRNAVPRAVGAG